MSLYTTSSTCIICGGVIHARNMCRSHYRKFTGENKRRWEKVKENPRLLEVSRNAMKRYKTTEAYRESKAKSDKKYYLNNKQELNKYRREEREYERFGVLREDIFKRDHYECSNCHSDEDLLVHHINNKGRAVTVPDNDLSNLITLCRSCHMKVHLHDN